MALLRNRPCWQCGHCSTLVCPEPAAEGVRLTAEPGHECPVCRRPLVRAVMDEREHIEVCERCKGILMPQRAFAETLTARRRAAATASVIPPPADLAELKRPLACPRCTARMITDWYYGPGGIVIDTCPPCEIVWLDAGELQRAVDAPGRDRRL